MRAQRIPVYLFVLWIIFSIFFGEKIPVNKGLGWDGAFYTILAQNIVNFLLDHSLSDYALHHIAPSGLLFIFSKAMHIPVSVENAAFLFSILNAVMLVIAIFLWAALAKKLRWNKEIQLISFAGLFFNFVNLKMAFYYPTLTDTTAFTIGLAMFYCYFEKKDFTLCLLAIVGGATFPTMLYVGMILFMFPFSDKQKIKTVQPYHSLIAIALSFLIIGACLIGHYHFKRIAVGSNYNPIILGFSIVALFTYLFLGLKSLLKYQLKLPGNLAWIGRFILGITIIGTITVAVHLIENEASPWTFKDYLICVSNQALAYPFIFIMSHTFYFGASIGLLIYFWHEIVAYIHQKGLGLFFVAGLYLVLGIGSESRQLINFLPLVVILTAEVLKDKKISWNFAIIYTLLNLLMSRFWLPLNHGLWPEISTPSVTLDFPMQWYFMNFGPWVSHPMYWVVGSSVALLFSLLYIAIKKEKLTGHYLNESELGQLSDN